MSLKDNWLLPLQFREDGTGSGLLDERPLFRGDDTQIFSVPEIAALEDAPGGLKSDRFWREQYGQDIVDEMRRFLRTLPVFLLTKAKYKNFAFAQEYYAFCRRVFPRKDPAKPAVSIRTLQDLAKAADDQGLLSLERGGDDEGIANANRNQFCLFFTSYQKHRLMLATGATVADATIRLTDYRRRPLSGPER